MVEHFLIGLGGVHTCIAKDDLETARVEVGKLGEIVHPTVNYHPIPLFVIVVKDDLGGIMGLLLVDMRAGIGGEYVLHVSLFPNQTIQDLIDFLLPRLL